MKRRPPRQPGEPVIRPIDYTINEDGCWVWAWNVHPKGYGTVRIDGHNYKAHRVAYELGNGPIPEGHILRHLCNNPSCINPEHLLAGTPRENMRDMVSAGNMWNQKLTREDAAAIRQQYAAGGVSMAAIARQYGVDSATVQMVIANKNFYDENYTPPKTRSRKDKKPIGWETASEIRRLLLSEGMSRRELAEKFNIPRSSVDSVIRNDMYRDPAYSPPVRERKFTDAQAEGIRLRVANGVARKELADEFEVSTTLINQIVARKIYNGEAPQQASVEEEAAPPRPTLQSLNGPAPTSKSEQERRLREQAERRGPDVKPYRKPDEPIITEDAWTLNPETGCHEWKYGRNRNSGHGIITPRGEITDRLAHRVSWILHNGRPIPEGKTINHRCDNPPCINPAHLYAGDHFANMRDTVRRGNHATQRLNHELAKEIRDQYEPGVTTAAYFAQKYGVGNSQILRIISNQSFPDPDYTPKNPEFSVKRKLQPEDAPVIRERWQAERISFSALAREYKVSQSVIAGVVYNKTYYDPNYTPPSADERRKWKLSDNDIASVIAEFQAGATRKELAEKYGVGYERINEVIRDNADAAGLPIRKGRNSRKK